MRERGRDALGPDAGVAARAPLRVTSVVGFLFDAAGRHAVRTGTGGATIDTYSYLGTSSSVIRDASSSDGGYTLVSAIDSAGDRLASSQGTGFACVVADLHGNVAAQCVSGTITDAFRYDAYGKTIGTSLLGAIASPWRYQGRILESKQATSGTNADVYAAGARSYVPDLGTFTSLDSVSGSAQNPLWFALGILETLHQSQANQAGQTKAISSDATEWASKAKYLGYLGIGLDAGLTALECGQVTLDCGAKAGKTAAVDWVGFKVAGAVAAGCVEGLVAGPWTCAAIGLAAGVATTGILNGLTIAQEPSPSDYLGAYKLLAEHPLWTQVHPEFKGVGQP